MADDDKRHPGDPRRGRTYRQPKCPAIAVPIRQVPFHDWDGEEFQDWMPLPEPADEQPSWSYR